MGHTTGHGLGTTYRADAFKTLGRNASESGWLRERVAKYESTRRSELLGWVISMISEHGEHGDGTIDWVEAWSDDPDEDWSLEAEANAETIQEAAEQMLEDF